MLLHFPVAVVGDAPFFFNGKFRVTLVQIVQSLASQLKWEMWLHKII